jgi:hypothetical protein
MDGRGRDKSTWSVASSQPGNIFRILVDEEQGMNDVSSKNKTEKICFPRLWCASNKADAAHR